ncbi:D-sedoheptulose 7-phosphate isomerase [Lewinella marina]|uniref:Phosphoheptose isomerase n=1 Tax=Neolewinella marina TaxID=438751 RepID=A0A2G0CGE3_9BACT|nr:SIS domain-containing protein [Neolewinella marina]NJB86500.1 D-sedoheptulose 7-phosphate isomerase [Neolewinella marina]PHK99043.1 phosphoheptose isomerase [Neolewinella marina]
MTRQRIEAAIAVKQAILADQDLLDRLQAATEACVATFRRGGKVLFCGNGGSAADAQHLAAELSGRFYLDRPPLFAEAMHVNTSFLTAVANDYGYDHAFSRLTTAMGRPGDVLFLLSTSGNSRNVLAAAVAGKKAGCTLIAMTGRSGGELGELVDILINIPSRDTPRIQEGHMLLGHILCEDVERHLFGPSSQA